MQKGEIMSEWADMPSARDVAEEQVCRILRLMYRSNKHKRPIQELCFETWAGVRVIEYPHNQMHSDCRKLESGVIIDESPKEIKLSMAFFNHKIDGIKARIPLRLRRGRCEDMSLAKSSGVWIKSRMLGSGSFDNDSATKFRRLLYRVMGGTFWQRETCGASLRHHSCRRFSTPSKIAGGTPKQKSGLLSQAGFSISILHAEIFFNREKTRE